MEIKKLLLKQDSRSNQSGQYTPKYTEAALMRGFCVLALNVGEVVGCIDDIFSLETIFRGIDKRKYASCIFIQAMENIGFTGDEMNHLFKVE